MRGLIEDFGGPLPLEQDSRGRPPDLARSPRPGGLVDLAHAGIAADAAILYGALLRSITGQQLSVRAAQAIYGRLLERFGGRPPTPEEILADDPDELRIAAGLSRAKTASLRS